MAELGGSPGLIVKAKHLWRSSRPSVFSFDYEPGGASYCHGKIQKRQAGSLVFFRHAKHRWLIEQFRTIGADGQ